MATGIRRRHSAKCPASNGSRCRCGAGWEASVFLAREDRKVRRSFATESEARQWRAEAHVEAQAGKLRGPSKLTVGEASWLWLEAARAGSVRDRSGRPYKPSTLRGYAESLRRRVLPDFAGVKLSELRRGDVQAFVDRMLRSGLAPGTIRNTLNPLQAIYRHAVRRDLVSVNPTRELDVPTGRGRRDRIATATDAAALVEALPAGEQALWATAFYAGLRRGELRALRWSDIDLGRSEVRVQRSWDQYEGAIDPKSETSSRTVPILAVLRDYLDAHKLRGEREGEDLVFGRTVDDAFVATTIAARAAKAWKAAKLDRMTLHECRHTFASLLIDAGVNAKAIQTFMGHATIEMTFNQYGHLMPGSRDQARELVDRYLDAAVAEARTEAAAADPCASGAPVIGGTEPLTAVDRPEGLDAATLE